MHKSPEWTWRSIVPSMQRGYCVSMRIGGIFSFDEIGTLFRKKRLANKIFVSFCVEEMCGSAHVCSVRAIAEADLVRWFRTCNNFWPLCFNFSTSTDGRNRRFLYVGVAVLLYRLERFWKSGIAWRWGSTFIFNEIWMSYFILSVGHDAILHQII